MTTSKSTILANLDPFTRSYLETALWASTEYDADGNMGESLDENYSLEDFTIEALLAARKDCIDFQRANETALAAAYASEYGYSESGAGHDFWLTRNRHGAGYWDRSIGEAGKTLTEAAHVYGSVDLYVCKGKVGGC